MTTKRVYLIAPKASTDEKAAPSRLVRATHPGVALRHVAEDQFTVRVATQDDLISCIESKIGVENAT